ncbi:hypothetical protein [Methanoculleus sp.]|jgi:uncharacterized protein with HEPN domain|uniref:hypothetical protein n=1 Tax=Methanoculleus sp. TaxID=90427 RepID=UPI001BD49652|nr:hypothetical protein [Methanoculleus sp.]
MLSFSGSSPIGEATTQISPGVTARHPISGWRKIAGLRDISVHFHCAVKPTIIRTELGSPEDAADTMIREEERR